MTTNLKKITGMKVQIARKRLKLSQQEVAELIDRSIETVSNIERGKTSPTVETLERLCNHLNLPILDFFDNDGLMDKSQKRAKEELQIRDIADQLPGKELKIAVGMMELLHDNQAEK